MSTLQLTLTLVLCLTAACSTAGVTYRSLEANHVVEANETLWAECDFVKAAPDAVLNRHKMPFARAWGPARKNSNSDYNLSGLNIIAATCDRFSKTPSTAAVSLPKGAKVVLSRRIKADGLPYMYEVDFNGTIFHTLDANYLATKEPSSDARSLREQVDDEERDAQRSRARVITAIKRGPHAKYYESVKSGEIQLGMPEELLLLSWGKPDRINESVGPWGVHKQYVYHHQYVYIENGTVASYQKIE